MLTGVAVFASIVLTLLAFLSSLVVPLVIATVIGILAAPLVDVLAGWRIPRWLGAVMVLGALLAVIIGSIAIAVSGVVDESAEIAVRVTAGIDQIDNWLEDIDVDAGNPGDRYDEITEFGHRMLPGIAAYLPTVFSSLVGLAFGAFLSFFMLYYMLSDWHSLRHWVGRHLGVPDDLGRGIIDDAVKVIQQGFYALTLSSLVTGVLIGLTMWVLGLPLAFTVAFVTFITSYIPYLGAIFSGAFGFLVALGSGTTEDAIILLLVILVVQNVVQTIVGNRLTSNSLRLHPLASLISTIIGAAIAGLLGAMLSAPILALTINVANRVRAYHRVEPVPGPR